MAEQPIETKVINILIQQQRNPSERRQMSWQSTSVTKTLNLTQGIQRKGNLF